MFVSVEKRSRYLLSVDPLSEHGMLVAALQAVYKLLLLPRVVVAVPDILRLKFLRHSFISNR